MEWRTRIITPTLAQSPPTNTEKTRVEDEHQPVAVDKTSGQYPPHQSHFVPVGTEASIFGFNCYSLRGIFWISSRPELKAVVLSVSTPTGNMETWGRKWSRGHAMIHWLLVVALCCWVKSVNPTETHARLPACPTGRESGNTACTCRNNNDGLQLTCNGRKPALTLVPSSIPENTAVLWVTRLNFVFLDFNFICYTYLLQHSHDFLPPASWWATKEGILLMTCSDLIEIRESHFAAQSLRLLFQDIPPEKIFNFLK